ncbi:hypothetical protein BDR04DRAFT_1127399 [Suillus decipiens]|nr:hypothetical protein BDR04DRAFT_1127399 [Suillus decipiens]
MAASQRILSAFKSSNLNRVWAPVFREAFLVTNAEDQTSFEGVPFANITLLFSKCFAFDLELQKEEDGIERGEKFMLGSYRRCALSVDIIPPTTPTTTCRFVNVHLDSLGDTLHYGTEQMEILANLLREPRCGGGLIAGDFNALLDKNGLVDAWVALHGKKGLDGATWGVGVAMSGVDAKDMEILRPGLIEVPKPGEDSDYIPCSDHYGVRLSFTV